MMVPPSSHPAGTGSMALTFITLGLLLLFLGIVLGVARSGGRRSDRLRDDYRWNQLVKIWRGRPTGLDWVYWHSEMDGHWLPKEEKADD